MRNRTAPSNPCEPRSRHPRIKTANIGIILNSPCVSCEGGTGPFPVSKKLDRVGGDVQRCLIHTRDTAGQFPPATCPAGVMPAALTSFRRGLGRGRMCGLSRGQWQPVRFGNRFSVFMAAGFDFIKRHRVRPGIAFVTVENLDAKIVADVCWTG